MAKKEIENLSPVEVKALYSLVSEGQAKKASEKIEVGEHQVEFTLHVKGALLRGANYEGEIVEKANPWLLLAVALSHLNGVTVESITQEALTADPQMVESLKAQAKVAIEALKKPTKTMCNGKVTVDLVAEKVSPLKKLAADLKV